MEINENIELGNLYNLQNITNENERNFDIIILSRF